MGKGRKRESEGGHARAALKATASTGPGRPQAHADERLRPSGGPGHLRAGEGRRRAPEKFGRRQNRDAVRGQVEGLGQEAQHLRAAVQPRGL